MANVQSKMGGVCFTKGLFYLTWYISLTTSFCSVSRTAAYMIPTRGCVGGTLGDGRPYPYMHFIEKYQMRNQLQGLLDLF